MLRFFKCKNYRCFRDETVVSFELNKNFIKDERSIESFDNARLSKATVVIGHNGSGKTALINALVFIGSFVTESFLIKPTEGILLEPYFDKENEPSEFEIVFDWNNAILRYKLTASKERVYFESLHQKTNHKFSRIFERKWIESTSSYDIKYNQAQFGFAKDQLGQVRQNASLISTAYQYGVPFTSNLIASIGVLSTNLSHNGFLRLHLTDIDHVAKFYKKNQPIQSKMIELLKQWDFGLVDLAIDIHQRSSLDTSNSTQEDIYIPFGAHQTREKLHWLNFFRESNGTKTAFLLLWKILPVLEKGGVAVIDELDAHLHAQMIKPILDLFFSPLTNPNNAQLIFTCQAMEVLSELHKDQIYLVEKDKHSESHAWRLDEMKGVRRDDNFYAKYMAGAYGAVPNL